VTRFIAALRARRWPRKALSTAEWVALMKQKGVGV
jgi:hypothetical protein